MNGQMSLLEHFLSYPEMSLEEVLLYQAITFQGQHFQIVIKMALFLTKYHLRSTDQINWDLLRLNLPICLFYGHFGFCEKLFIC